MADERRGKAACQTCRARHYDCDKREPECQRCLDAGRTCVPAFNIRFRRRRNSVAADAGLHMKGKLAFDKRQKWVKTPRTLSFVEETPSQGFTPEPVVEADDNVSEVILEPSDTASSRAISGDLVQDDPAPSAGASPDFSLTTYSSLPDALDDHQLGEHGHTLHIASLLNANNDFPASPESLQSSSAARHRRSSSLYVDRAEGNLINRRNAELLHYFKTAVGKLWYDVIDPEFTEEALGAAPGCPLLLYSMLAIASIHKSRFAVDAEVARELAVEAEGFHEQCVSLLLPMLNDPETITDGAFLACSTILRFYEELSSPVHGRDDARHLLGGYASVAATQASWCRTSLSNAAFWIHQRQDSYNALINQRMCKIDHDSCGLDRSAGPADGHTWAKRAMCMKAEVIDFCLGPDAASAEKYHSITGRLEEWERCKPDVFTPVFYHERDASAGRFFPDVFLLLDYCAYGLSYHYFSMLLMAAFDPTAPRIGPMFIERQKLIKEKVLHYLRLLCGLACSNPVPPARVITCLAISQCGLWVTDPEEQRAMIEVLRLVEREDAWPTYTHQETLKAQWGHII